MSRTQASPARTLLRPRTSLTVFQVLSGGGLSLRMFLWSFFCIASHACRSASQNERALFAFRTSKIHSTFDVAGGDSPSNRTVLQQHVDFWDEDKDGVIYPLDTYRYSIAAFRLNHVQLGLSHRWLLSCFIPTLCIYGAIVLQGVQKTRCSSLDVLPGNLLHTWEL